MECTCKIYLYKVEMLPSSLVDMEDDKTLSLNDMETCFDKDKKSSWW